MSKPKVYKVYKYKGKLYSNEYYTNYESLERYAGNLIDLLQEIANDHPQIYKEETVTTRYIGGEYAGTDDEKSDAETLDELIEYGYGEDIELEEENHCGIRYTEDEDVPLTDLLSQNIPDDDLPF